MRILQSSQIANSVVVKSPLKGGLRSEDAENAEPVKRCDPALAKCDNTSSSTVAVSSNGIKSSTLQSSGVETGAVTTNSGERYRC